MWFSWIITLLLFVYIFAKRADLLARFAYFEYQRGNVSKALVWFRRAGSIGNMSVSNKITFGYLLLRNGIIDEAEKQLNLSVMQAAKPFDKNRAKAMLALVTWKRGYIDDAVDSLENLLEDFKNTNMYQNLGLMYIIKGDKEKSLSFNLEAYDYNNSDKIILDNLAESYYLNNDLENAKKIYDDLMELDPHFPEAFYGYGRLLIDLGEKERGLEMIKTALDKPFTFLSVLKKENVEKFIEQFNLENKGD